MRVVLDTNVLTRAVRGGNNPATQVLEILLTPPHVLIASEFLLGELGRVLRYTRVQQMHGLDDASLNVFVQSIRNASLMVELPPLLTQVASDKDDDPIIATAIEGQADVLCTWDRHLFAPAVVDHLGKAGIRVVQDSELMAELRGTKAELREASEERDSS